MKNRKIPDARVDEHADKELYPKGTDLLWMAHFMPEDPAEYGSMNGPSMKISGTLEEAARIAEHESRTTGKLLQCLRRRY